MVDLKKDLSFLPDKGNRPVDFQDSIGISGFNNVVNKNVSPIKRSVWLFLLLGMSSAMTWQIVERLKTYFSNPLAINIEVDYETHVRFPVIVLCNLNTATISGIYGAYPSDLITNGFADNNNFRFYYDYLAIQKQIKLGYNETFIHNQRERLKQDYNWFYEPESIPKQYHKYIISDRGYAHDLSSMLDRCSWQDKPCTVADFIPVINSRTMEVCYAFNAEINKALYTAMAGRKWGLEVTLDVQQYLYMDPSIFGAGLKVAILDSQEDAASAIDDIFHQVPAGMSVTILVKRINYSEVAPPIGTCNETTSLLSCMDECHSRVIMEVCGCKQVWMDGPVQDCTIEQSMNCVQSIYLNLASIIESNHSCNCRPKCFRTQYETSMSVSPMSDYMASSIMLITQLPAGLEKIGRIHDWSYLDRRNRSLTNTLWSIGRKLKHIHESIQLQIFYNLSSYFNILQYLEKAINISNTQKSFIVSKRELEYNIRNLSLQYSELNKILSTSFFSVLHFEANLNDSDKIVDDFYVRCANDILRHNGTHMKQFYLNTINKIDTIMASLKSLSHLSDTFPIWVANITKDDQTNHNKSGMTYSTKTDELIERFCDLKGNFSSIYKMYMEVYTTVHSDSALLNTRDWGKIGESEDFYKYNYVHLNIFYESLSTTWIKQFETDSLTSLICDLGGNIGLWLGGSLLTLFEMLDLMLVIIKRT